MRKKRQTEDNIKQMTPGQLDQMLCVFYQEVRTRSGAPMKEHALKRLRTCLMKYLQLIFPALMEVKLTEVFTRSSALFNELLQRQPAKSTEMLTPEDCCYLRGHPVLATDNPLSLLRKVRFELQLHFGARCFSPKEMCPELFMFVVGADGAEYVVVNKAVVSASNDIKVEVKGLLVRRRMKATGRKNSHHTQTTPYVQ